MSEPTWDEVLATYAARLAMVEEQAAGIAPDDGSAPDAPGLPATPAREPTAEQRRRLIALMERNAAAQAVLAARMDEVRTELRDLDVRRTAAREYTRAG